MKNKIKLYLILILIYLLIIINNTFNIEEKYNNINSNIIIVNSYDLLIINVKNNNNIIKIIKIYKNKIFNY